jgi:hypothetical protein
VLIEEVAWDEENMELFKAEVNLRAIFRRVPGSYVDVLADTRMAVVSLRGPLSRGRDGNGHLSGHTAQPVGAYQAERDSLVRNRLKWERQDVGAYSITMRFLCNCQSEVLRPVSLVVREGWSESFRYGDDSGMTEVPTLYRSRYHTVAGLFDQVEKLIAEEEVDQLRVSYDPDYGFPTNIYRNEEFCISDDELSILISDFSRIE